MGAPARAAARVLTDPIVGTAPGRPLPHRPAIARGGMASVYEATDTRLDRTVAGQGDAPGPRRRRGVRGPVRPRGPAAARLDHPTWSASTTRATTLRRHRLPGDGVRPRAHPARRDPQGEPDAAVAGAGPRSSRSSRRSPPPTGPGLIHRDVKPENVLIADEAAGSRSPTSAWPRRSAPTPSTPPPAACSSAPSPTSPPSWSSTAAPTRAPTSTPSGCVLYELLTGTKPHEGESPIQVAYKHVHEDVPPPSPVVPGLPAYVDALVSRATARDLDQRPADAGVLLHQVHRVAQALRDGRPPRRPELTARPRHPFGPCLAAHRDPRDGLVDDGSPDRPGPLRRRRVRPDVDRGGDAGRGDRPMHRTPRSTAAPCRRPATRSRPPGHPIHRPRRSVRAPCSCCSRSCSSPAGRGRLVVRLGALHHHPGRPRPDEAAAEAEARGRRAASRSATRPTPRPSPRVACSAPTRRPAARCSTAARSRSPSRWARSATTCPHLKGQSEDQAQDALLDANLAFGSSHRTLERDGARGHRDAHRPAGRHHPEARRDRRPGASARAASRSRSRTGPASPSTRRSGPPWSGRARGERDRRGVQRHRRRGRRHLAEPRRPARCSAATRSASWSRWGPSWSRCPAVRWPRGWESAPGDPRGGRVRGGHRARSTTTSGSASSTGSDPGSGDQVPQGSTVTLWLI